MALPKLIEPKDDIFNDEYYRSKIECELENLFILDKNAFFDFIKDNNFDLWHINVESWKISYLQIKIKSKTNLPYIYYLYKNDLKKVYEQLQSFKNVLAFL